MDAIIDFLYSHLLLLEVIGLLIIVLKSLVVALFKGADFILIIENLFKFYNKVEIQVTGSSRQRFFKKFNNYANILIYTWIAVIIMIVLVTLNTS
jgi:hypothetical protein